MKKLMFAIVSILVSMLTEVMLRKLNKVDEANAAEENAVKAAVALGLELASQMQVPVYLLPVKYMVLNEKMLEQIAKFTFDQAENQIHALLSALDQEKLAQLQADLT